MATYVMSDIHGQLVAFNKMLERINFKQGEKSEDTLYLLGDYVDWGARSIETLLKVIEMSKTNTHCLMGNHDLMMYKTISCNYESLDEAFSKSKVFKLWASNLGDETFKHYLDLDRHDKDKIKAWLSKLRYFVPDVEVNGRKFYLCHSKPFVKGMKFEDVVWQRLDKGRLPRQFIVKYPDTTLISGHTITVHYNSTDENGKYAIYYDNVCPFIDIDCGAKGLGIKENTRLACIRLDDMTEYYVE